MRRTSSDQEGLRGKGVEFWEAFRFWVKLGFISFGPGGQRRGDLWEALTRHTDPLYDGLHAYLRPDVL
jgi:hypothetical protein